MKKRKGKLWCLLRTALPPRTAKVRARSTAVKQPEEEGPLTEMVFEAVHVFKPPFLRHPMVEESVIPPRGLAKNQLVFLPCAVKAIREAIHWGQQIPENKNEQQGFLVGSVYQVPSGYLGVVEAVLVSTAKGTPTYTETTNAEWAAMDRQLDALNAGRYRKLVKIGWWHTHPNMAVFMSNVDKETQRKHYSKDWQFAAVLNPQAQTWATFSGEDAAPCMSYMINYCPVKNKEELP